MSKIEKKDPIGDFFKKLSGKSKEVIKKGASNENIKKIKDKTKGKELYIFGGIALVVVLILFLIFGTNTFETPIKNMVNGINQANFKTYIKDIPDFILEKRLKFTSLEKAEQNFMDTIVDEREEYGHNYKVSYKILEKEALKLDDLYNFEDDVMSYYSKKVRVTKGYKLKLVIISSGSKKEDSRELTCRVYKIDGKWYTATMI